MTTQLEQKDNQYKLAKWLGDVFIFSMNNKQTVGEKRDYYITLRQLDQFATKLSELLREV